MSERSNIEIDYCPTCRGVWLDRGELDKIIERSVTPPVDDAPNGRDRTGPSREHRPHDVDTWHGTDGSRRQATKKKRKGEFLADLFDFGG